jgi:hypothetical protein
LKKSNFARGLNVNEWSAAVLFCFFTFFVISLFRSTAMNPRQLLSPHQRSVRSSALSSVLLLITLLTLMTLSACRVPSGDPAQTPTLGNTAPPAAGGSFAALQEKLLTPNCASSGCHDAGTKVGGLDLSPANAYRSLMGVEPTNENARKDKLLRVKAGDPYKSFLYIKLDSANLHASDGYGSVMPLGSRPVTAGQLEFVKQWIAAGASKDDPNTDVAMLTDTRGQNETLLLPLPAQGRQFHLPPFRIAPNTDREFFTAQVNPTEIWMNKFELIQRDRSHHFILYAYNPARPPEVGLPAVGAIRDLYLPNGTVDFRRFTEMSNRLFIIGTQLKQESISFPEGYAMRIPANYLLDLNSHYTNGTRDSITGEVYFNVHSIPTNTVKTEVKPLQLSNLSISLPPNKETVYETTYLVGGGGNGNGDRFGSRDSVVNIFGLTSHFHKLGKKFIIQIVGGARNGEVVYSSTNWLNPPLTRYDRPIVLRRGEGLKSIVTWFNDTDQTVRFGLRAQDEMNFIFGYYY